MPVPPMIRSCLILLVAVTVVLVGPPTYAQNTARIFGIVTDDQGAPVEGAVVTIEFTGDLDLLYEATTNDQGEYRQMGLARGPYDVTFTTGDAVTRRNLVLSVGMEFELDVQFLAEGEVDRAGLSPEDLARLELAEATDAAFLNGLEASRAGNLEEAIDLFNEAIAGLPECYDCYRNLGIVEIQRENYEAAETALTQATTIAPDDAASFNALADLYNATRRFDEAGEAAAEARRLSGGGSDDDPSALFDAGLIAWNAGQLDEARGLFEQTLTLDPNHGEANYWMAMASLNGGQIPEAVTFMRTYLEREPSGRFADQATALLGQLDP